MANRLVTRQEFVLLSFVAVAILVGSGVAVWSQRQDRVPAGKVPWVTGLDDSVGQEEESSVGTDDERALPVEPDTAEDEIVVEVVGAVYEPGVYRFSEGATVADAIEKAGGGTGKADFADLNRAAPLLTATRLTIPEMRSAAMVDGRVVVVMPGTGGILPQYSAGWVGQVVGGGEADGGKPGGLVNINTATAEELETLPRVGPKTAQAIMEYRRRNRFVRVEDIEKVSGIGPKTFEGMRPLITVN